MKTCYAVVLCAFVGVFSVSVNWRPAAAATAEVAAGTFTSKSLGGGEWQYDMTLINESSVNNADTTIGTFWFSWAPMQQYMEADPTNIQAPANWTSQVTGNPTDGFGIQFVVLPADLLTAGHSQSGFVFDSTETPTQLSSPSSFFQHQIETTSAAYTQGPFSDSTTTGDPFEVTPASITTGGGTSGGMGAAAVPLPTAAWQALTAFLGFGAIAGAKRLKSYIEAAKS